MVTDENTHWFTLWLQMKIPIGLHCVCFQNNEREVLRLCHGIWNSVIMSLDLETPCLRKELHWELGDETIKDLRTDSNKL